MASNFKEHLIHGGRVMRLPCLEIMPFYEMTLERWHREGLPPSVNSQVELHKYFGLTPLDFFHILPDLDSVSRGSSIADMAAYRASSTQLYNLDKLRCQLAEYQRLFIETESNDGILWVPMHGFFWHPRDLFGAEEHLLMYYDNPELIHEVSRNLLRFNIQAVRLLHEVGAPAIICISEDMAYKSGSMISKAMFNEFLAPYHRQLLSELVKMPSLAAIDTDGDVTDLVPLFEEIGYHCINPMERQTGMDLLRLREHNPEIAFIGGFNKRVMEHGPDAIDQEFEDLKPLFRRGKYLPAVDHQTPPSVSLTNYRYYVDAQRRFLKEMIAECNQSGGLLPAGNQSESKIIQLSYQKNET